MAWRNQQARLQVECPDSYETVRGLTIMRSARGTSVRLQVAGELDSYSALVLERGIRREEMAGAAEIAVDLASTTFIDAAGVGALVGAARRAGSGNWRLQVDNATGTLRKVLDITHLEQMIDYWQSAGS